MSILTHKSTTHISEEETEALIDAMDRFLKAFHSWLQRCRK